MLDKWLDDTSYDKLYWSEVRAKATVLKSDGCSGVPDWLVWTCWEHDIHTRTHKMVDGTEIDFETAAYVFRRRIQQGSPLPPWMNFLSPSSWWRWGGVRFSPQSKRAWAKGLSFCLTLILLSGCASITRTENESRKIVAWGLWAVVYGSPVGIGYWKSEVGPAAHIKSEESAKPELPVWSAPELRLVPQDGETK